MATSHSFQALGQQDKDIDQDEIVSGISAKHTDAHPCAHAFVCVCSRGRESINPPHITLCENQPSTHRAAAVTYPRIMACVGRCGDTNRKDVRGAFKVNKTSVVGIENSSAARICIRGSVPPWPLIEKSAVQECRCECV